MKRKPHLVIFNPDHYRGDVLGHAGNPGAVTPNLDALVKREAVSFTQAFCQNPVCTPSRCSFMSGWYPHVRGHRTMAHLMQPGEPVLLKTLKDAGYWVWWGGKNDLAAGQFGPEAYCNVYHQPHNPEPVHGRVPEQQWRGAPGSDSYYGFYIGKLPQPHGGVRNQDSDWQHVLAAIDVIRELPEGQPLCIYLPLIFPHLPYAVEEPFYSAIDRSRVPARIPQPDNWAGKPAISRRLHENYNVDGWSEERWREAKATYYGMCARIDHQAGMIVDALKQRGIWDDTAFFFFSDHGEYAGDYGLVDINQNTFEDSLVRVPFVLKPPKNTPLQPGLNDSLIELVDFPATVEELTGASLPADHFGRSLLPVAAGKTSIHRDAVFCEGGRLPGEFQAMEFDVSSALTPSSQYWPRLKLQRSDGPEHGKAVMCRTKEHKYVRRMLEKDELYDLRKDPGELCNVADAPEYAGVLAAMKDRLLTFLLETNDVVPRTIDRRMFTS